MLPLRALGHRLAAEFDVPLDPNRLSWAGSQGPTLHLDDVSAIPFLEGVSGVAEYQHRARVRAGTGDLFAVSTAPSASYEAYCQDVLGLGAPRAITATPGENPTAVAEACLAPEVLAVIVEFAREAGRLTLHPYMGIDPVWELARAILAASGVPVDVLAPPPPVTWVANDKAHFTATVRATLGDAYLPETHVGNTVAGITEHLIRTAAGHRFVGLKRPRCASAMGNAVYDAAEIRKLDRDAVRAVVQDFLARTEWPTGEPVLAMEWLDTELSPSTQLWIPREADGPPILEGIYEQLLEGEQGVFLGSRPSTLPDPVNGALADSALRVATVLQGMGYVGRCSFDHLVVGDPHGEFRTVFIECNGRWGGTSTPMALVDRLVDGPRPHYRAQDYAHPTLVDTDFGDILAAVGDHAFDPRAQSGEFLFYNTGPLRGAGKLDVIAIADTPAQADELILDLLPTLLGIRQ